MGEHEVVGGTNGKGSTAAMTAAILQAAGYRVGLYTSPHLIDFRERIRINGVMIPEDTVSRLVETLRGAAAPGLAPTFFEFTTVLAFQNFADCQVDVAVLEVGLGGRFDATNVVDPLASRAITTIGLDHEAYLGSRLEAIAFEKAGIVKPAVPVVLGRIESSTRRVIEQRALEVAAPLYCLEREFLLERTLAVLEARWSVLARASLAANVTTWLNDYSNTFVERQVQPLAVSIIAWLPAMLLGPFFAFFFLRDGRRFHGFIARAVPNAYFEKTLDLLHQMHHTGRSDFAGLMKLSVLDTVALGLGLWALGLPGAWLLALVAAVLAWVPYVGSIAGCLLVVLVAATDFPHDPKMANWAIMLFIFVRLLDDFVFMPATVGKT